MVSPQNKPITDLSGNQPSHLFTSAKCYIISFGTRQQETSKLARSARAIGILSHSMAEDGCHGQPESRVGDQLDGQFATSISERNSAAVRTSGFVANEPTVDIVIVNWNYARFVGDAIKSVKDQSYKNIRCIVVDNDSDDDSVDRIAEAIGNHPQFAFHRVPNNLGHLGGALWALKHATGEFITFLDADDVLFPDYITNHLQTHLAAEISIGFTSSNNVDINADGELLTSGNGYMYSFWQNGTPALRPFDRTVRLRGVDDGAYSALAQAARYLPANTVQWFWCAGFFRRALLNRVLPTESSPTLFGGVDGFFLPILHALNGSVLIDQPLSAYRLHDSNDHSDLPRLHGLFSARPKAHVQAFASYLRMMTWLVDHLDDVVLMTGENRYWQILATAEATHSSRREAFSHPQFRAALARRYSRLVELFGELRVFHQLRQRMRFSDYLKIVLASRRRTFPAASISRAFSLEIARKGWLIYKKLG
jgi:glycosyltransferase involved in cell wall biosynthesis